MSELLQQTHIHEKKEDRLAQNLSFLMKKQKVKESDLSRALNLPYVTIHRLVTGQTTDPRLSTLQQLANYFSISLDDLTKNNLPSLLAADEPFQYRKIPLLSWEIVSDPHWKSKINLHTWQTWEPIALHKKEQLSDYAYALKTRPSMQPRFPLGTLLVIDSAVQAKDGDLILVRLKEENAISLRHLIVDPPIYQLEALTDSVPTLVLDHNKHCIIGVVVLTLFYNKK